VIVASNDLDEHLIASLKKQGATIGMWGVGTRLATAYDQPALGGVYKLSAIRCGDGPWQDKVKVSEQTIKVSTPGVLQVRRYRRGAESIGDAIYDLQHPMPDGCTLIDPIDVTRRTRIAAGAEYEDLLEPVFRGGRRVQDVPSVEEARQRARRQLATFRAGIKRFDNPHEYPVGLERGLHDRKTEIILQARGHGA
jgi:nicotinate phosphoribosyltransferase